MKLFVTGHKGFIGTHLLELLKDTNYKVTGYDLKDGDDVRDYDKLVKAMKGHDVIVHLAAFVSVPGSWEDPKNCFDHNVVGTMNVVQAAEEVGIKGIVYASSAAIYDSVSSPYALSKEIGEDILKTFKDRVGSVSLRFFNIYGPGQNLEYAGVIPIFEDNLKRFGSVTIFGDGKQTRDFIHVKDIARAIFKATQCEFHLNSGAIAFDIGTGQSVSINGLARVISNVMDSPLSINYKEARKEVRFSEADTSYAKFVIGFDPTIELEKGLNSLLKGVNNV